MKPLFLGEYCPNDCDRKRVTLVPKDLPRLKVMIYSGTDPRLRGRPAYPQSACWRPTPAGGARVLSCPICDENLICGPEDPDGWFGASCRVNPRYHCFSILNDEF